jgi:hypothetical protein
MTPPAQTSNGPNGGTLSSLTVLKFAVITWADQITPAPAIRLLKISTKRTITPAV